MKKLALITMTILGVATFVFAQEKKQATNKNDATFIGYGRPLTPEESAAFKAETEANNKSTKEVSLEESKSLVAPPSAQKAERDAAPVQAAPRQQSSKPVQR